MTEISNPQRMQRCATIAHKILLNWQQTNSFGYTLRATDAVQGIDLAELRKRHFLVGVGDDLTEVPLNDVLVVFAIVQQQWQAMNEVQGPLPETFKIAVQVPSDYSDDDAVRRLSGLQIETPFDKGTRLRIVATPRPTDGASDDSSAPP